MSTKVKTGWLHDINGDKFAPKTLTSQVQTSDGTLLEDKIQADLDAAKAEFDAALANKSDSTHKHDDLYDAKNSANEALETAKGYTDSKTANLITTSAVDAKISTHNASTSAHNDIRALVNDLSTAVNNFLDVDDTTKDQLSEVLQLIENNKGTLESLTTSKVNVSDIVDNLTTNASSKVLSAAQGVAIKKLIDALQAEINAKLDIDNLVLITVEDIDTICGDTIQYAEDVTF